MTTLKALSDWTLGVLRGDFGAPSGCGPARMRFNRFAPAVVRGSRRLCGGTRRSEPRETPRVQSLNVLTLFLSCSFFFHTAIAQQADLGTLNYTTTKVADSIYMLSTGAGGNIGLMIGDDGAVLIDDQFDQLAPKLRAAVALLTDKPIRFVINTHWHGDHTGANAVFGRNGSIIVAQGNVRRRMNSTQIATLSGKQTPPAPAAALPVVTFEDSLSLHVDGEDLDVFHVANAHTDGDAIIRFRKANVVHMGDTLFVGSYPFIDSNSGGTLDGMIAATARMLKEVDDNTRIIPGHGPLAGKAQLQEFHDMLATVRERVARLIKQKKTLDEVIAAKPSADFDGKWAGGFWKPEQWISRVYVDLKRTPH
jgi:glyoxylase-like metal-dependent hydrolase (beta-lactamase superfamily II)